MKKKNSSSSDLYYVYQLVNDNEVVEYVGVTKNPTSRWKDHTRKRPSPKTRNGKFWDRKDIHMDIICVNPDLHIAYKMERHAKITHGLEPTEETRSTHLNPAQRVIGWKDGIQSEWFSLRHCARELSIARKSISDVVEGKKPHHRGWVFQYKGLSDC